MKRDLIIAILMVLILRSPISVSSQWREDWQSATVINSSLVDDPSVRPPGFHFPQCQWLLLNRFWTVQDHCSTSKKWGLTDYEMCVCSDIQTMSHIVDFCPLTKLDGGLQVQRLHAADKAAVDWLTSYGT